jgi:hypothetical protein
MPIVRMHVVEHENEYPPFGGVAILKGGRYEVSI